MTSVSSPPSVAVAATIASLDAAARQLARDLGLPALAPGTDPAGLAGTDFLLQLSADKLALRQTGRPAPGPVSVDFGSGGMRHRRRAAHNEMLGRAVGVRQRRALAVVDATAGLGRDGFVLADLGCHVVLSERNALVATLLASGLQRAANSGDDWLARVVARMQLWRGDCRTLPSALLAGADVLYLDPMFPPRDKSAGVKKEMVLLQKLLGESDNPAALLDWALQQDVARVVVKRPGRAGLLAGPEPSHAIRGKAVRYDVYVRRGLDAA
jgi:16S rRNA (guanine1516-N2)-methyltransferase